MNVYSLFPLLTCAAFAGLALLAAFKAEKTTAGLLFIILCVLGSFLYLDIFIASTVDSLKIALAVSRIDHFFIVYLLPVYIHFFHAYLGVGTGKKLIRSAYGYAFILMCFTPTPLYIRSMNKHFFGYFAQGGVLYPFFGLGCVAASIYVLILLYRSIKHEKNGVQKNRLKYIFAGLGMMGLLNGLDIFTLIGYSVYPPGNFSFIPLTVFAVGLFKHDLLDMGILINKSLVYSILTVFLTFLYALIIWSADYLFKGLLISDTFYVPFLFFLLIAFILGPVKSKTQQMVDTLFFKGKYDYQSTLKDLSKMITSMLDMNTIAAQLVETISKTMKVDQCAVFLKNDLQPGYRNVACSEPFDRSADDDLLHDDNTLIDLMKTTGGLALKKDVVKRQNDSQARQAALQMDRLHADLALPMVFKDKLNGFMLLGEKPSGELFSQEDFNLLETLAGQSALAVENALSYKVIDDLNQNLEKKTAERTRMLQQTLAEKERAQEQLVRSESLAAIGQLVAGAAHELNNPLAGAKSLIQSTIEDLEEGENQAAVINDPVLLDDLKFADQELGRAKEIVSSLLSLSRQTRTYTESVDLNLVVQDALRVLYNQYKRRDLDIEENYDHNLPLIQGNFANLGQVVLNIVKNAVQAVIDTTGRICLKTYYDDQEKMVCFECVDTGPGIDEEIRKAVFNPFFTTKNVGEGTGLGLYICHEILQKHGGSVSLKNDPSPGAAFIVKLPATQTDDRFKTTAPA